jgi:hypothetical protein
MQGTPSPSWCSGWKMASTILANKKAARVNPESTVAGSYWSLSKSIDYGQSKVNKI